MSRIVKAARTYIGVKFRHRGRKPSGLDCAGLIWISYKDCGVELPDFRNYGKEPYRDGLNKHVSFALGEPISVFPISNDDLKVGDVAVMRFLYEPHHLGIISDYPLGGFSIIHADGWNGRVIEQRLSTDIQHKITHLYRRIA